ncbi:MAG: hypothetical protein M3N53_14230 [Actinomycetota bacterium]|nr:hypothetical protein [Actinomycetota bacterium]
MKAQLLDHVAKKHGVTEANDTLVDYLLTKVSTGEGGKKDLKF